MKYLIKSLLLFIIVLSSVKASERETLFGGDNYTHGGFGDTTLPMNVMFGVL